MSESPDLNERLDRLKAGTASDADVDELRKAYAAGDIRVEERAVHSGGDIRDSYIITGDGNVVNMDPSGEALTRIFADVLDARAAKERVPLTRHTWRPWLRRQLTFPRVSATLAILLLAVALPALASRQFTAGVSPDGAGGIVSPAPDPDDARPMRGGFNVAVADFGRLDEHGQGVGFAEGGSLAQAMYDLLSSQLRDDLSKAAQAAPAAIEVRSIGRIAGTSEKERSDNAARLADDINAHLVVYGNLSANTRATTFAPEFYLSGRTLTYAEELEGQYKLGSRIEEPGDITANGWAVIEALRDRMLPRVTALAQFVRGLSYYQSGKFEQAATHFQAAAEGKGWEPKPGEGKEVVYLFWGNAVGQLPNPEQDKLHLERAKEHYEFALKLNPTYARAMVGLAEVQSFWSVGECQPPVDLTGLDEAMGLYMRALRTEHPPAANIGTKVALGLGRLYTCLRFRGPVEERARFEAEAERQLRMVVAQYEAGNELVREWAAEAHGFLAVLATPSAQYQRAAAEYETAIKLSSLPRRQGAFYGALAYILRQLKDYDQADIAYREAARLNPREQEQYDKDREAMVEERRREPN